MQVRQPSYAAPKEPLTFGHQVSEIILGISYFSKLSNLDKNDIIEVLFPVAIRFFKQKNIAANLPNAFALRDELRIFSHDFLLNQESNYQDYPDSRTKKGKNIDNAVLGLHFLFGKYLEIRRTGRNPNNQVKNNSRSNFNRDERLVLGMPEGVAPIAISFFLLMLFYLVWVYFIKGKK